MHHSQINKYLLTTVVLFLILQALALRSFGAVLPRSCRTSEPKDPPTRYTVDRQLPFVFFSVFGKLLVKIGDRWKSGNFPKKGKSVILSETWVPDVYVHQKSETKGTRR